MSDTRIRPLVQPRALPRRIPRTIRKRAPENVTRPSTSVRRAPSSRDSEMRVRATANANTPTGMFTKKIQRHPRPSVRRPPTSGPQATAAPTVAPQTASAPKRSVPRYSWPMRASAVANSAAPPIPCSARATSSAVMLHARPQRSDDKVKQQDACHEDQPAPIPVRERTAGENQRGERERVGVHDPLQAGQARIEALLHVRQRDDHDSDVEEQHERRQADSEERPLPRAAVCLHAEDAYRNGRGPPRDPWWLSWRLASRRGAAPSGGAADLFEDRRARPPSGGDRACSRANHPDTASVRWRGPGGPGCDRGSREADGERSRRTESSTAPQCGRGDPDRPDGDPRRRRSGESSAWTRARRPRRRRASS